MPGLSLSTVLAGWFCLPALWAFQGLATAARYCRMRGMFLPDFCHSWNDLSPHAQALEGVVSRHLVGHKSEDGGQRSWIATDSGAWELRNHALRVVAQTQARHGQARPRTTLQAWSGIVEVDESYIGGKKAGKRGHALRVAGKTLVVIAAQLDGRRIEQIRLRRVTNASASSLEDAIERGVEPGTVVRTDGWKGYNRLDHLGYIHEVVREQADVGDNLLSSCHRVAGLLKRWLLGTHQGAVSHALREATISTSSRSGSITRGA